MENEIILLTETQASEFLTIGARALQSWRVKGGIGPKYLKIGRLVRYRKCDLETWLESRVRESTSDVGRMTVNKRLRADGRN